MNNLEPSQTSESAQKRPACFICKKAIADRVWFRRVSQKIEGVASSQMTEIMLCSPACALRYFGNSQANRSNFEPNYDGYEHSLPVPKDKKNLKARKPKKL